MSCLTLEFEPVPTMCGHIQIETNPKNTSSDDGALDVACSPVVPFNRNGNAASHPSKLDQIVLNISSYSFSEKVPLADCSFNGTISYDTGW